MEDSPLLLLLFIVYLIAGFSGKKKGAKRRGSRRGPMRSAAQGEQADIRAARQDQQTQQGFETAFADHSEENPCERQPIHLHAVTQEQMSRAGEGEDPCHAGDAREIPSSESFIPELDEAQQMLREDVLRGVIMSEILKRPQERTASGRGGQRRHGY